MRAIIDASEFKRLIDNTKKFTSNYSGNVMMSYIYLEINAETKEVRATALDGYKVSIEYANVKEVDESFNCFIKPNIPKITQRDRLAELELVDNRLLVTVGDNITGYVQPQCEYFKVDEIIKNLSAEAAASTWVNFKYAKIAFESVTSCKNRNAVKVMIPTDPKAPMKIESMRGLKYILPVRVVEE